MTDADTKRAGRRQWLSVLARAPREELEAAATRWQLPAGEPIRAPEAGMVMLRGRVGGTGEPFNLGEATVTRCAMRIGDALGVGYVLGRDTRKAELVAGFDALLQDAQRQGDLLRGLIEPLQRAQARRREQEAREVAGSRVEFFTMVRGET